MPIIASSTTFRAPKNNNPIPDDLAGDLAGEQRLAAAVLRQALADLRSPRPLVRAAAVRFWESPRAVAFWDELLDLNGKLARLSQALLLGGLLLLPACIPPPGSDAARAVDKAFGVPGEEERLYCSVVQQAYLKQSPPQLPPSCKDILKAQRERQAVQP